MSRILNFDGFPHSLHPGLPAQRTPWSSFAACRHLIANRKLLTNTATSVGTDRKRLHPENAAHQFLQIFCLGAATKGDARVSRSEVGPGDGHGRFVAPAGGSGCRGSAGTLLRLSPTPAGHRPESLLILASGLGSCKFVLQQKERTQTTCAPSRSESPASCQLYVFHNEEWDCNAV